jgi:FkbM family methyltransferase
MIIRDHNLGHYIVPDETSGGICLEIGANVGSFTEKYANHFSVIHYYEPLTECFNLIKEKLQRFNHIKGYNLAGYNTSGETLAMVLHHNRDSGSTGLKTDSLNKDWTDDIVQKVSTISLKDMLSKFSSSEIDFCKSDCETGEYYIFMNSDVTPINYLALEMHCQIGVEKWNALLEYLEQTHELISGDRNHTPGLNKDLLFKRR